MKSATRRSQAGFIGALVDGFVAVLKGILTVLFFSFQCWVIVFVVLGILHFFLMDQKDDEWGDKLTTAVTAKDTEWRVFNKETQDAWKATLAVHEKEAAAINAELFMRYVRAVQEAQRQPQIVEREVVRYVPAAADAACTINLGFLRGYAEAVTGTGKENEIPGIPSGPAEAPTGTQLSTVLATTARNIGGCREAIAEIKAWREWYPRHKKACEDSGVCEVWHEVDPGVR